jgi:DeoR/GlpR family transcriptional regulator of sugar metabolism
LSKEAGSDVSEDVSAPATRHPVGAADRRHTILLRVAEEQTIHVGELARDLGVSEMTIRRDIRRLERDGFVRQTYGGATAHLTRSLDVAFNARALQHAREKRLIGMRATQLVADARVLFIGIGTTADELTCVGPTAVATLEGFRFDLAVIGAGGLSARWGITEDSDDEATVQRAAIDRAERVVVIADGSKLGTSLTSVVGHASRIASLVTDRSAPPAELAALGRLGIEIVVTDQPPA